MSILDAATGFLWILIFSLIVLGGYQGPKAELSQVDIFAWILLLLLSCRYYKMKTILSKKEELIFQKVLKFFENKDYLLLKILGIWTFLILWIQTWRHWSFQTNTFDMGFLEQAIWSNANLRIAGDWFHSTISNGETYLGEHFAPILAFISLFYKIHDSASWVFFFQGALSALGGLAVFYLAKEFNLKKSICIFFTVLFFCYQPLRGAALFDFREDLFFIPIYLTAILLIERQTKTKGSFLPLYALVLLGLCVKENASLLNFMLGLLLITKRYYLKGVLLSIFSLLTLFAMIRYVMPFFSGGVDQTVVATRFQVIGNVPLSQLPAQILTHPIDTVFYFLKSKISLRTLNYFYLLFFPAFIFLKSNILRIPSFWIAFALACVNTIVGNQSTGNHYDCVLIPFFFHALLQAYKNKASKRQSTDFNALALTLVGFLCVFGRSPILRLHQYMPTIPYTELRESVLDKIPGNLSIATQSSLHPHLLHRQNAYLASSDKMTQADVVIASFLDGLSFYATPNFNKDILRLRSNPEYSLHYESPLAMVFCKKQICHQLHLERVSAHDTL